MENQAKIYEAKYGKLFWEQLELESEYKSTAEKLLADSYEKHKNQGTVIETNLGKRIMDYEFDKVFTAIDDFVTTTVAPKRGVKPSYSLIVSQLNDIYGDKRKDLVVMLTLSTFSTLLNGVFREESRLSNLARTVGTDVQAEAKMEAYLKAFPEVEESVMRGVSKRVQKHYRTMYANARMRHSEFVWTAWSTKETVTLGAKLIELVVYNSNCFELYDHTTIAGDAETEVHPTNWLIETWSKNEDKLIAKAYINCPTIIPPADWEDFRTGGYYGELRNYSTLLRLHSHEIVGSVNTFSKEYLNRLNQLDLAEVRDAVNAIQSTAWTINKRVLAVAKEIVARGGNMAGIPSMEPIPGLPRLEGDFSEEQLKEHKKKAENLRRLEARRKSRAFRVLRNIETAERYNGYSKLYFPHNMDFRGRVYPIPSFSPQGDDLNKSLLLFADTPACSSMVDIEWLMVHGANLAGVDKVSFAERKQWVLDNEERILASAADPMEYRWWAELDDPDKYDPFQFLSFCMAWADWKDHEAKYGTPEGFKCGIAIAFDGTCSGLQHFSAILRDPIGGKAVNLLPADKPQDIYGMVAEVVNKQLQKDAMSGTPDGTAEGKDGKPYTKFGTRTLAQQWLAFGVNRKVTKRSVMTLAYGSKEYGFREQILEDTIEPACLKGKGSMFISKSQAAGYMAKLIWQAVKKVVVKAVEGMDWLQQMARLVCKEGRVVTWMTPMGLPVQQSYMVCESEVYRMRFSGIDKRFYSYQVTGNIDKRAQAQGIAPNFIHSMDAAHLQLTVNMAHEQDINHFAMIHDSYAAPVSQADMMFKTVRESFIRMYSENDVLESFKADMELLMEKGDKIPAIPSKGTLDLNVIRESLYTFH